MAKAIVFPGQGSQAVGMGKDLADAFTVAREVFWKSMTLYLKTSAKKCLKARRKICC